MLFNSNQFVFLFLPVTLAVYLLLNKFRLTLLSKSWLVISSLFFYGYWNFLYLPLIMGSIIFNYTIGTVIAQNRAVRWCTNKQMLTFGIIFNIALLGYFKYTNFFITNINYLAGTQLKLIHAVLPLGISFFTFTQIAYLVDTYGNRAKEYNFINYCLFVTFFPHLLAGPIIHHRDIMPQFNILRNKGLDYKNLSFGILLFFAGLFKKMVIADTFAIWTNKGFDIASTLTLFEAWSTSLSYTFQIYFDFSGYTDMALGIALMFSIKLPINFNSPYKSRNIQEFWRRWHITLSNFQRDYVYVPLGGNRQGRLRTLYNLMITFLLGGLWHGAGWTFVFWGFLHGTAMIIYRSCRNINFKMNYFLSWFITFNFINITWVFFRARTWQHAVKVIKGMLGLNGLVLPSQLLDFFPALKCFIESAGTLEYLADGKIMGVVEMISFFVMAFFITQCFENSNRLSYKRLLIIFGLTFAFSMQKLLFSSMTSEFLYFRF